MFFGPVQLVQKIGGKTKLSHLFRPVLGVEPITRALSLLWLEAQVLSLPPAGVPRPKPPQAVWAGCTALGIGLGVDWGRMRARVMVSVCVRGPKV